MPSTSKANNPQSYEAAIERLRDYAVPPQELEAFARDVVQPLWRHHAQHISSGGYAQAKAVLAALEERIEEAQEHVGELEAMLETRGTFLAALLAAKRDVGEDLLVEAVADEVFRRRGITPIRPDPAWDEQWWGLCLTVPSNVADDPQALVEDDAQAVTFPLGMSVGEAIQGAGAEADQHRREFYEQRTALGTLQFRRALLGEALDQYVTYGTIHHEWRPLEGVKDFGLGTEPSWMSQEEARIGAVAVYRVVSKERSVGEAKKAGKAFFDRFGGGTTERSVDNWVNGRTRSNEITDEKVQKMKERKEVKDFVKGLSWTHGDE
ncbi:MAG: hypothetical protein AAF970_11190 [Bacteroidota bacterium]